MTNQAEHFIPGKSFKEGPVIYHPEDLLIDEHKSKKNLTLVELNRVFQLYLEKSNLPQDELSILGQFTLVFNDPLFIQWHGMSKQEQSDALSEAVKMPQLYDELITSISITAGDASIIKSIVKDAYQNAIDSFSHAAFLQQKYSTLFPGIKIILYIDQLNERLVLAVVDNGYGNSFMKPKKTFSAGEPDDDFLSRIVDWIVTRYFEKEQKSDNIRHDIAYTGGQGMALKKIKLELQLDTDVHFLNSGAVFETKLKSYF